jgi:DNA (cytosine-5)-methyltransferase 1
MNQWVSVDLFAGAGGASTGLRCAGLEHAVCVEWDEDAAKSLKAAGFPAVHGDVRDLSHYEDIERVDLLWASPPCQAFSTAGERKGALDERNGWPWTLDIIDHLQSRGIGPRYVMCENVPGLTYHKADCTGDVEQCPGCYWRDWIIPEFKKRFEWVGHIMLDAADYGVPQHRRRIFLVAGEGPVKWPSPTHGPPNTALQGTMFGSPVKPWKTIRDALGMEKFIGGGRNPTPRENDKRTYRDITNEPSTTVAAVTIGNAGPFVAQPGSEPWRLDKPSPAVTCRDDKGARHQKFDPSKTPMTAADATWRAAGVRRLTWRECAKLQAFPDDYPFEGRTKKSLYRQVGNAVCPPIAEILGRMIIDALEQ